MPLFKHSRNRFRSFNYRISLIISLLFLLCLTPLSTSAQTIDEVSILLGSPEAVEMAKYGNMDVSMFKGVPNVSVPIYTLESRDLTIPIFLSYNSGGIQVDQISTSVGLGWTVHGGGQITAAANTLSDAYNPRELPDLENFYPQLLPDTYFPIELDENEDYQFVRHLFPDSPNHRAKNTEPDVHYINYPGYNGKFVLEHGLMQGHTVPYTNHDIEYTGGVFKVKDDRGNVYYFDLEESTTVRKLCKT